MIPDYKVTSILKYLCILLSFAGILSAQTWHPVASPTRQNLARLDMLSDTLGYAVSYDGLLLKYDGYQWAIFDSIGSIRNSFNDQTDSLSLYNKEMGDIYTIRIKEQDKGWLAINNAEKTIFQLFSFIPQKKTYTLHDLPIKVRALDFNEDGRGIAVGEGGAYAYDGIRWKTLSLPVSVDFKAVHSIGKNKFAICGDKGIVLIGNPAGWELIENSVDVVLRDADFISEDEGWFVGYDGVVLHYKNGYLEQELAETTENLWAVDMLSDDYGFAVGTNGVILQYNGIYWDIFPYNPQVDLHDIEMINEKAGFALGARGTLFHFSEGAKNSGFDFAFLFADQVHLGSDYLMDRIDDVRGVTAADFNNDHKVDLYLTCYRSLNHLLINSGQGYFRDFVIESGTGGNIETRVGKQKYEFGSLAADFDRDGDTDLFLAGRRQTSRYFVNKGNAVFTDETDQCGLPENLEIIDGALADVNRDGYPDLVLADENEGLLVYLNDKYNTFRRSSNLPEHLRRTGVRAVKVVDLNQDHLQDILVVFQHMPPMSLINKNGEGWTAFDESQFEGFASEFVNSVSAGDINNDGYTDLFFCSEDGNDALFIFDEAKQKYINRSENWGLKKGGRSYSAVIADFDMNGTQDIFVSRYGSDLLYMNYYHQFFKEQAADLIYSKSGYLSGYNTGMALIDLEGNGTPDLIVGNADYWSSLLQNQTTTFSRIEVNLEGIYDTREALGAKLWLWEHSENDSERELRGYHEVLPSSGLFSQNEIKPVFATNPGMNYDLEIRFLNGDIRQVNHVNANEVIYLKQTSGFVKLFIFSGRRLLQLLHIPYMGWEILKFLLFIGIILASVRFIEQRYQWRTSHAVFYVILILPFYILITYLLRDIGVTYHFLPFAIVGFVLLVLVAVNEPIRISNQTQRRRQEKLNQAGMQLSRTYNDEEALHIVIGTLKIIQPFKQLAVYLYHENGNYLLCQSQEGFSGGDMPPRLTVRKETIISISRETVAIPADVAAEIFPTPGHFDVFSLVRKKQFLGLVVLGIDKTGTPAPDHWEGVRYLFLQLAIALDNIRIMTNLREQEKIGAIGTFAGGIIHNLKNPIDGLRMIIEILHSETPETDSKFEYIDELYHGIMNLKKQLMRSFEFSMNRNQLSEIIEVTPWIAEISGRFNAEREAIELRTGADNSYRIKGDREQLSFAIENILQNALDASENGNPVKISLNAQPDEQSLQIQITDSGTGIADEKIDKIFEMFYTTRGAGRGLGLTITKNIIRNHGGTIEVESKLSKGTVFTLSFPLVRSEGYNE